MIERLQNDHITLDIAPGIGGRIVSLVLNRTGYDFLWRNERVPLRLEAPGTEYDPNFFGGIEELIPNDIPEAIAEVDCHDHGELWTQSLACNRKGDKLNLTGELPKFCLQIEKAISLQENACRVTTRISNKSAQERPFLWKLHAALGIQPGDQITCSANAYHAVSPDWSRRNGSGPWQGETIPQFDDSTEFLFLYPLSQGLMGWQRGGKRFEVEFDPKVFPYAWYFASYGGFDGHRVAILEPCTAIPLSVNEALQQGTCSILKPGQTLETTYRYRCFDED